MYPFFASVETAKDLWNYKGQDVPVIQEGNTFRANRNGIEYTCTLTQEGEVTLRRDQIRNTTDATVCLVPMQARFGFPGGEFEVYTQYNINFRESTGQWQPLMTKIETFCASMRSANGATPFLALWDQQGQRGMAYHLLVDSAWEMAAFRKPIGDAFAEIDVVTGFHDSRELTLAPGEVVQLPTVLFYNFRNKLDMDAWKLHRWFHTYHPRKQPPILYNTWLYKFDNFTPALKERIKNNIAQIKENREFWQTAECRILGDTQRLWALQYNDPSFDRVEVTVFLLSVEQKFVTVYPVVDVTANYELDGKIYSGEALDRFGLQLPFKVSMSAQRICLKKVK